MSYCRWSTDKFKSDVYVYESCYGDWTTHVAGGKRATEYDGPDPYSYEAISKIKDDSAGWKKIYDDFHRWLDNAEIVPIGLEHDGETFHDNSPGDCAATLRKLRGLGYYVPDGVIEELEEEQKSFDPVEHKKQTREFLERERNG